MIETKMTPNFAKFYLISIMRQNGFDETEIAEVLK